MQDIYREINGEWEENCIIPPDESEWGTFEILEKEIREKLKSLLSTDSGLLGKMWFKLNRDSINQDNIEIKYLSKLLYLFDPSRMSKMSKANIGHLMALSEIFGCNPFIKISSNVDPRSVDRVRLTMSCPTLVLPDRTYYLDVGYSEYIDAYSKHISDTMNLYYNLYYNYNPSSLSNENQNIDPKIITSIETEIAKSLKTVEEKRNSDYIYCRMPIASFIETVSLDPDGRQIWRSYFETAFSDIFYELERYVGYVGYSKCVKKNIDLLYAMEIVVYDMAYFQKLTNILISRSVSDILSYIKYKIIAEFTELINSFDNINFEFYDLKIHDQKCMTTKSNKALKIIDKYLGEELGKLYVKQYFDSKSKAMVESMAQNIKEQMQKSIDSNDWMTHKTKARAKLKLNKMNIKIGYPNKYEDSSIMIDRATSKIDKCDSIVNLICYLRACEFYSDILSKIDTPKDNSVWSMNPQKVNAYYNPQFNEMVFPAAILSDPLFGASNSMAQNYGMIGTIIAHEITHGFDDQGSRYDEGGRLNNWWDTRDREAFKSHVNKVIAQYSKYEIRIKDSHYMKVNGILTVGENIADIGGVRLAFRAFVADYTKTHRIDPSIDLKKEFFISYAKLWRRKMTPQKTMAKLLADPHSPSRCRAWAVRNVDEFYEVFNVECKSPMYLKYLDRIKMY